MNWDAFFAVHSGLYREGPGTARDVEWACAQACVAPDAAICDAACGPGADISALRAAAPQGHVTAFDKHLGFVAEAAIRHRRDDAVTVTQGVLLGPDDLPDPVDLGPFDLIWCAGAIYITGVEPALKRWRGALKPGGAVAFSAPVNLAEPTSEMHAFWEQEVDTEDSLDAAIHAAGFGTVASSRVPSEGWEAYYAGVEARCDDLSRCEAPAIRQAVAENRREAEKWRALRDKLGYALRVVRPS
ncbi:class I SAM-dependent methyltransferase [Jannaschia aquimarina]|uniref:Tam_3 protein n=1 Tax=Jannaschia aquimarina TaxID=935700 RepID=A0A0D1CKD0_9RHOB|nr:class I SAM-dependent methyltransferase [Jannaschia aquimarina]KIT15202.1 Trans-aconitate 2-methyltransferase [Jannaschia aquimarina]SNT32979.1 Methyltransferase domain-containing protein [Jannaschia aquimarina]